MKKLPLIIVFLCLGVSAIVQDTIRFLDSTFYTGTVVKLKRCEVVFKHDGIKSTIPDAEVYSVKFGTSNSKIYNNYIKKLGTSHQGCFFRLENTQEEHIFQISDQQILYGSHAKLSGIKDGTTTRIEVSNEPSTEELEYYQLMREKRRNTWRTLALIIWGLNILL